MVHSIPKEKVHIGSLRYQVSDLVENFNDLSIVKSGNKKLPNINTQKDYILYIQHANILHGQRRYISAFKIQGQSIKM